MSKDLQEIFDEFEVNFETFSELREEFLDNDDSSAENQEVGEAKFYNEQELREITHSKEIPDRISNDSPFLLIDRDI